MASAQQFMYIRFLPFSLLTLGGPRQTEKLFSLLHSGSQAGQEAQQTDLDSFLAEGWENLTMSTEASG